MIRTQNEWIDSLMKRIYVAANLPDAHIVLNLVERAGIQVEVINANAQSGVGEMPFTHAYPEVWVMDDNDFSRARKIVTDHEHMPEQRGVVHCSACGEGNPRNFELCWNCGKPMDA
jgi:Putative prokaryotic signal transducing protein